MVQVVLSILKPAGSAGATVQLTIAPPKLLKVMFVMAKSIIATWSAPAVFTRLGAGAVPPLDEEPHAAIDPSALIITLTSMPLLLFKTMAQSRRGVPHILEVQVYPLVVAIPRFINRYQRVHLSLLFFWHPTP
jgi:hypothetical protein